MEDYLTTGDICWLALNRSGDVCDASQPITRLLHRERTSILGRSFRQFVCKRDRDTFDAFLHRVFVVDRSSSSTVTIRPAGKRSERIELEGWRSSDGDECHVLARTANQQCSEPADSSAQRGVTQLREAEKALQESDERWKFAIEGAGDGLWDRHPQTGVAFYSKRWKEMLGYRDDEIGDQFHEFTDRVHPDDLAGTLSAIQTHLEGRSADYSSEFRMRCKDGTWKWILARGKVVRRGASGEPLRTIGTHKDISDLKAAEEREIQNLQLIATGAPCPFILDAIARSIETRHPHLACCVALADSPSGGITFAGAKGMPVAIAEAINRRNDGPVRECCRLALRSHRRIVVDDIHKQPGWHGLHRATRKARIAACWFEPIQGTAGTALAAIICFSREARGPDASEVETLALASGLAAVAIERANAQADGDARTAQLSAIYHHAPILLVYMAVERPGQYRILSANKVLLTAASLREEQVIGKLAHEVMPAMTWSTVSICCETAVRTKTTVPWQGEMISPDGRTFGRASVTPALGDGGAVTHLVVMAHDITQSKRMEAALKMSQERLALALRHAPIILSTQDSNLKYTWVHSSRRDLPSAFVEGKTDAQLFPAASAVPLSELKRKVLETGRPLRREVAVIMPSREIAHFDLSVTPLRSEDRKIIGVISTALDITERVDTGAALRFIEERYRLLEDDHERERRLHDEMIVGYRATQKERLRLAGDLHDGLMQYLVAADFRIQAAEASPESASSIRAQLATARQLLKHMKSELRNSIWGLQVLAEEKETFLDLLRHCTSSMTHWPEDSVVLTSKGQPRELSPRLAGNLLLLFQEAVGNAFTHGSAKKVAVHVVFHKGRLDISIKDDGKGFIPDTAPGASTGHFGLAGMRRRVQGLGGNLRIHSSPGAGTEIRLSSPLPHPGREPIKRKKPRKRRAQEGF
jgi:PAS domain S-box-containing protein